MRVWLVAIAGILMMYRPVWASAAPHFIVGTEDINFYPHYDFTPTAWLKLRNEYRVKLYEVPNAVTALNLVLKGQLDGADVEYHVAQHILRLAARGSAGCGAAAANDPGQFSFVYQPPSTGAGAI